MPLQQKPCNKCGEAVNVIPAGVSKKNGKPYGSFAKCNACGNSEKIGAQPNTGRPQRETSDKTQLGQEMLALLRENNAMLRKILGELATKKVEEEGDLPY